MKKIISIFLSLVFVFSLAGCNLVSTGLPAAGGSGTLNLYNSDPMTLDPALAGDATSYGYIIQIFSGLVKLDANLEPVADIASAWQESADGLTYTFTLRHRRYLPGRKQSHRQ